MDLLKSNIKKINKFKKIYKLKNVSVYKHNFLNKIKTNVLYHYSCCHNWVQHSALPEKCLKNIFDKTRIGGKFYISTYHENFFRFTIAFIARQIIKSRNNKMIIKYLLKNKSLIFKKDLSYFNNRDEITFENMTDDFTTPYLFLTNYNRLKEFIEGHGFKLITKKPTITRLKFKDNHQLKMGFVKIKNLKKYQKECFINIDKNYPIMKSNKSYKEINDLTQFLRKKFKQISYDDCSKFLLKLYLLRAKTNKSKSQYKIIKLLNFLKDEKKLN